jgi:hypothetical protein
VERKGTFAYNKQEKGIIIKKSKKIMVRTSRVAICNK